MIQCGRIAKSSKIYFYILNLYRYYLIRLILLYRKQHFFLNYYKHKKNYLQLGCLFEEEKGSKYNKTDKRKNSVLNYIVLTIIVLMRKQSIHTTINLA